MKKSKGFTLIELMIVVTIIGILAAISIPTYQGYVAKSQVKEAFSASFPFKLMVSDYYHSEGIMPLLNEFDERQVSKAVFRLHNNSTGRIRIKMRNNDSVSPLVKGKVFFLRPIVRSGRIADWRCLGGTLGTEYLPLDCQV